VNRPATELLDDLMRCWRDWSINPTFYLVADQPPTIGHVLLGDVGIAVLKTVAFVLALETIGEGCDEVLTHLRTIAAKPASPILSAVPLVRVTISGHESSAGRRCIPSSGNGPIRQMRKATGLSTTSLSRFKRADAVSHPRWSRLVSGLSARLV
jgi:hypothetical protein